MPETKEVTLDENGVVQEQAARRDLIAISLDNGHGVMNDLVADDNEGDELNMNEENAVSHDGGKVAEGTIEDTIKEEI